jgi:CheY-like chemotaxis protein
MRRKTVDHHNRSRFQAVFAYGRPRTDLPSSRPVPGAVAEVTRVPSPRRLTPEEDSTELLPLPQSDESPGGRPVVLVADDDKYVRHLLGVVLQLTGFEAVPAASGREALSRFLRHPRAVAVALLDVRLPGWSGPQTLAVLRRFDPRLVCCFMTGDPFPYTEADLLTAGAERVFRKPLVVSEVAATLRRLTGLAGPSG